MDTDVEQDSRFSSWTPLGPLDNPWLVCPPMAKRAYVP